jgi:hypothetical protein
VLRNNPYAVKFVLDYNNELADEKLKNKNLGRKLFDVSYYCSTEKGNALHLASQIPSLGMICMLSDWDDKENLIENYLDENIQSAAKRVKPGYLCSRKILDRLEKRNIRKKFIEQEKDNEISYSNRFDKELSHISKPLPRKFEV